MPATSLYYIPDSKAFAGGESSRQESLLAKIDEAARCGIDYIQLREKDLPAGQLEKLATAAVSVVRSARSADPRMPTRLLVNARPDVALASGADGVHLRARDIAAREIRGMVEARAAGLLIAVSCHTEEEVARACGDGADFVAFGPVFEKKGMPEAPAAGLAGLHQACQHPIPVFAVGGVTAQNAQRCLRAGASGLAAIRLFQSGNIEEVVRTLHG